VTGLSGAGKSSILHALEDLGLEAVDNPPLSMATELIASSTRDLAIGVDARTSGFDVAAVLAVLAELRAMPGLKPELIYATADEAVLQRRYTATRRRHPMAPVGTVTEGIAAEHALIATLREVADSVIDTSELTAAGLRRLIETRYGTGPHERSTGLTLSLVSFAFPAGLPREADMVLDARFLRNPFYDPTLSKRNGMDAAVAAHVRSDPDYQPFLDRSCALLRLVLPRFVAEGKKYATVAVGCSGGRHRSVTVVEALARCLSLEDVPAQQDGASPEGGWPIIVTHRELLRLGETNGMTARAAS
jgi:UPF0042 nucleotide-binding protein